MREETFNTAGGLSADKSAKWNGATWSPVGSGMGGSAVAVYALTVFDDGGGPALYAGGVFGNFIAKWNGVTWSSLGSGGVDQPVLSLAPFDDGAGPALYAGGGFSVARAWTGDR